MPNMTDVKPNVKTSYFLSPEQRLAIASSVSQGRSQTDVAKEFNVSIMTVSRIMRKVRSVTNPPSLSDWKSEQTNVAVSSINNGLRDDEWVRRGELGVKVLTGLQVYRPATDVNVSVNVTRDLPADWRGKYITLDDDDVKATLDAGSSDTEPTR